MLRKKNCVSQLLQKNDIDLPKSIGLTGNKNSLIKNQSHQKEVFLKKFLKTKSLNNLRNYLKLKYLT